MPDSQKDAKLSGISRKDSAEQRAAALRENLKKRKNQAVLRTSLENDKDNDGRDNEV